MTLCYTEPDLSLEGCRFVTFERWEQIRQLKTKFLENADAIQVGECSHLDKAIIESWRRSRELGISPYVDPTKPHLSPEKYRQVVEANRELIDVARPLLESFKGMTKMASGYILYLCDRNGTFLLQCGDMVRAAREGLVWSENTIGTCAHSLCMRLKQPVQLIGPEHYCVELKDIIASAAPIFDERGEPMASLILGQPFRDEFRESDFEQILSHTLALIAALAKAVELKLSLNQMNCRLEESVRLLMKANCDLTTTKNLLETTFAFIDDGIITIDAEGTILNINKEGKKILKLREEEVGKRNIKDYLMPSSQVLEAVASGKNVDLEEAITAGNDEQPYIITVRPIMGNDAKSPEVAVLKLNHTEKVNAMAVNRTGAVASYRFENIIGEDREFKRAISLAKRFANCSENILLIGESGTGKELFAQSIHNACCPNGPFMAVNCAALPRELIESELFGYEGGSFTGAERSGRPGKIELAHGGTLFLDEIGDMPLEIQAVLLRTLEDKQVMRIGGRRYKKVDFRLIAATNKDLYQMVQQNLFREDLYFRLSVLTINIPPLRRRKDDILLLSRYFIRKYCEKQGIEMPALSPATVKILQEYPWPGNIRQLQNALIFAVNSVQGNVIEPEHLPHYIQLAPEPIKDKGASDNTLNLEYLEKNAIMKALQHTDNSIPEAAKLLGISRSTLYRKIKEFNLST